MGDDHQPERQTEIGGWIRAVRAGEPGARQGLFDCCYGLFAERARALLNRSKFRDLRDRGIGTGDVVHETVLERIFKRNADGQDMLDRQQFEDPQAFVGAVARHMEYCLRDIVEGRGNALLRQRKQRTNADDSNGRQKVDKAMREPAEDAGIDLADLLKVMEQLDDDQREVIRLRYLLQMSRDEAAEHLAVSPKTVTRRVRRAKERLACLIEL